MKNYKQTFQLAAYSASSAVFIYLGFCFVKGDPDPFAWHWMQRLLLVVLIGVSIYVNAIISFEER